MNAITRVRYVAFLVLLMGIFARGPGATATLLACPDDCEDVCGSDVYCTETCSFGWCNVATCGDWGQTISNQNACHWPVGYCEDGICDPWYEDNNNCSADCFCGDGICLDYYEIGQYTQCVADCGEYTPEWWLCDPRQEDPCGGGQICDPSTGTCSSPSPSCGSFGSYCDNGPNSCCSGYKCSVPARSPVLGGFCT